MPLPRFGIVCANARGSFAALRQHPKPRATAPKRWPPTRIFHTPLQLPVLRIVRRTRCICHMSRSTLPWHKGLDYFPWVMYVTGARTALTLREHTKSHAQQPRNATHSHLLRISTRSLSPFLFAWHAVCATFSAWFEAHFYPSATV